MSEYGLQLGTPEIKSAGRLTFGPEDILFLADNVAAKVFAIEVSDAAAGDDAGPFELERLQSRLCSFLGCNSEDLRIRDMAVHPRSGNVYLSVSRGRGASAIALLMKVARTDGSISEVPLRDIRYSEAEVRNPPHGDQEMWGYKMRSWTVTDMVYLDGTLLVAGASNEEFSSRFRRIPFPFEDEVVDNSLEIYHVSHGMYETAAPIRTFIPYGGERSILASYTCTPLVRISLAGLPPGAQAKGETVADLGNRNQPIDMVAYTQADREFVLISNSEHPLMKIACADIDRQTPLDQPQEPLGVPREDLPQAGVRNLANLNGDYVLMLQRDETGEEHLRSYSTTAL